MPVPSQSGQDFTSPISSSVMSIPLYPRRVLRMKQRDLHGDTLLEYLDLSFTARIVSGRAARVEKALLYDLKLNAVAPGHEQHPRCASYFLLDGIIRQRTEIALPLDKRLVLPLRHLGTVDRDEAHFVSPFDSRSA